MGKGLAALFLLAAAAMPAAAQDMPDPALCQVLTAHRPAPDVEYTPGIDVRGNPVAPADLPGSAGALARPERFSIPVTLGFLRRMGVAVPRTGLPRDTEVGTLVLDGDRLSFNGQPLDGGDAARLVRACGGMR